MSAANEKSAQTEEIATGATTDGTTRAIVGTTNGGQTATTQEVTTYTQPEHETHSNDSGIQG